MSNCNEELHNELLDSGDISCPFCYQNLDSNEKPKDRLVKYYLCCKSPEIINDNGCQCVINAGSFKGIILLKSMLIFIKIDIDL